MKSRKLLYRISFLLYFSFVFLFLGNSIPISSKADNVPSTTEVSGVPNQGAANASPIPNNSTLTAQASAKVDFLDKKFQISAIPNSYVEISENDVTQKEQCEQFHKISFTTNRVVIGNVSLTGENSDAFKNTSSVDKSNLFSSCKVIIENILPEDIKDIKLQVKASNEWIAQNKATNETVKVYVKADGNNSVDKADLKRLDDVKVNDKNYAVFESSINKLPASFALASLKSSNFTNVFISTVSKTASWFKQYWYFCFIPFLFLVLLALIAYYFRRKNSAKKTI